MDHRAFLASLSAETRAELTARSDRAGLIQTAGHWGAILAVGAAIGLGAPGWPVLLVVQGILICFLFTGHHEMIHRTAFESERWNDWAARICGFLIFLPSDWFRYFHFAHHRHTHDPGRDPELAEPKPESWSGYGLHVSGLPVWRGQWATMIRNARGACDDDFVPRGGRTKVAREARTMLALYGVLAAGSLAAGSGLLFWVWILPAILGQPFLRLYLLAEHTGCPHVADMFENTRTTTTNGLMRWLAWNMPYHIEHHTHPTVPFHKLPALHALAKPHLKVTERGYLRFTRTYVAGLSP